MPSERNGRRAATAASVSIALAGSGGSGVMTAGTLLLDAAAKAGLYGLMVRTSGPQIRGGEAAALVRLARAPTHSPRRPLRPAARDRLAERQPLRRRDSARRAASVMIGDPDEGEAPEVFRRRPARATSRCRSRRRPRPSPGSWTNMVALGLAGALAGIAADALAAARARLVEAPARGAGGEPRRACTPASPRRRASTACRACARAQGTPARRWLISGNEAAGYGAIRGGVRFVAAYPITPATELLEWMAPALTKVGGTLLQAEDELASVNMIIGASYGGVPSLTATAGPGLALMTEGIGLAVSAEVPIVVVDVMRGGPSTGIPAKSEQSDLSFAVSGLHGDAPRLVLAPTSIADCLATTQWAVELAEALQAPAIVLSDQFMGQSRAIIDRPADVALPRQARDGRGGHAPTTSATATPSRASRRWRFPGTPGVAYTADGLEHTEAGIPSSQARDHRLQLDKRERKLVQHDYGRFWADIEGDGDAAVITFGSTTAAVREARRPRRRRKASASRLIALRLLAPAQPEPLAAALARRRPACWSSSRTTARSSTATCARCTICRAGRELPPPRPAAAAAGRAHRRDRRMGPCVTSARRDESIAQAPSEETRR